jgi:phosphatidylglycerol lysyltransferase
MGRLRRALPSLLGLVVFAIALVVLRRELHGVGWHDLGNDVANTPPWRLMAAIALTALNYAVLTGYDFLAFATIGKRLPGRNVAFTSFLAYAVSNNIGFAMLSGASIRYRFYTRAGVTPLEMTRIVFSYSVTFWLGLLALGGASLIVGGLPAAEGIPAPDLLRAAGFALVAVCIAYIGVIRFHRGPLRIGSFELPLPTFPIGLGQLAVSALDWGLVAAVLYILLPPIDLGFVAFLAAFLGAQIVALVSHVPGGVGVFEGLMILFLKPLLPSGQVLPALVVFRLVYYLLPLALALVLLVADEMRSRRSQTARLGAILGQLNRNLAPRVLAAFAFLAGLGLLFSGATPAAPGRLDFLARAFPLGVIEVSHFVGSIAGAGLLLISQGLSRRLDGAYYLAVGGIGVGIAASLLKGADYEEATLLAVLLVVLLFARSAFDRRAAFLETRFSAAWIAAVAAALVSSVWLGLFAFKHVEYAKDLWWQFELTADAPRFLRASVGVAVALLLFAVRRLLGHAPHEAPEPTERDLVDASRAIAAQSATSPNLVFLRDKALLFDEERRGFVMYGVQGRTWVALGDPVGPPDLVPVLLRLFLEKCDDYGGIPVFYEVSKEGLHGYADFGLSFVKLGEEARVDLQSFSLEGPQAAKLRQARRRLEKDGASFRILPAADLPAVMAELEDVSNQWLRGKSGAEKGFSLGFFERSYVARFPVAVIERAGRIVAFANLWPSALKDELSVDLMRYNADAPSGVMEALFAHLLGWGKGEGYRWFALGMAPLSGFESSPVAPLWNRLGAFLYAHGESLYNFQGLRAYKDKFGPVWEPRYLVYPGGLRLPRVLADVAALIAGGYARIFRK